MIVTRKRSLAKAVCWRIIASFLTAILVLVITGQLKVAVGVGLLDAVVKFIGYYGHERLWNSIKWGRKNENG